MVWCGRWVVVRESVREGGAVPATTAQPVERRRKQPGRLSLARRAVRDLEDLARLLSRDPAVCTDGPPLDGHLELQLRLDLLGGGEASREPLAAQVLAQVETALRRASRHLPSLQAGEAWCFLCRRPGCPHAQPPDRQTVFAGYNPTGTPRWEPFAGRCLSLVPERADRLFGPHAETSSGSRGCCSRRPGGHRATNRPRPSRTSPRGCSTSSRGGWSGCSGSGSGALAMRASGARSPAARWSKPCATRRPWPPGICSATRTAGP